MSESQDYQQQQQQQQPQPTESVSPGRQQQQQAMTAPGQQIAHGAQGYLDQPEKPALGLGGLLDLGLKKPVDREAGDQRSEE